MRKSLNIRRPLLRQMVVSYVLFLILPCVLLDGLYLFVAQRQLAQEQLKMEQETLSQYCSDVGYDVEQCESVYRQIQQHSNFLRYLNGYYSTAARQLEVYNTELKTMFIYAESWSHFIEAVRVYPFRAGLMKYDNYILDPELLGEYALDRDMLYGFWQYDAEQDLLLYRRALRDVAGNTPLAILEIACKPELLADRFSQLSERLGRAIYATSGESCYQLTDGGLSAAQLPDPDDGLLEASLTHLSIQILMERVPDRWTSFGNYGPLSVTALFAISLLGLLSLLFFVRVAHFSRRIVSFSHYISTAPRDVAPDSFRDDGQDEFALLVRNFNQMLRENRALVSQIELERLQRSEMAYKMLQAQIDPHFVYNVLENIHMLAELHGESEISEMVFSLGRLLRYTFSANPGEQVSMASELDLLEQYLKIQKMRLGGRLDYRISCPDGMDRLLVPQFTIQPLAENAIKHGMKDENASILLEIAIEVAPDSLRVQVYDNGASVDAARRQRINEVLERGGSLAELSSGTGVGLDSINTRMRYLYPESFSLRLCDPEQGSGLLVLLSWNPSEKHDDGAKGASQ